MLKKLKAIKAIPPPKKDCTDCSKPDCAGCANQKKDPPPKPASDKDALIEELLGTLMDVERPQVLAYLKDLKHGSRD